MDNLKLSGHETFACKQFWLKKGYDFVAEGNSFNSSIAVSKLGVGKNMVTAINYWTKSFGVIDEENRPTKLGDYLFGSDGKDQYLEDIGSLWLLHYHLVSKARASIYHLIFNEFTSERVDFSKDQLHNFLKRKCFEYSETLYNESTINKDISVFLRNYLKPQKELSKIEIEEVFSSLLLDLELLNVRRIKDSNDKVFDLYFIESKIRNNIPHHIVLFTILDNLNDSSITFNELLFKENLAGRIFCLNREGLYLMIEKIVNSWDDIIFSQTAGNEVLQLSPNLNKWKIINEYYNQNEFQSIS